MGSGYFHTSYRDEIKLFQTRFIKFWLILLGLFLIVFPFLAGSYLTYLINISMIAIIVAL